MSRRRASGAGAALAACVLGLVLSGAELRTASAASSACSTLSAPVLGQSVNVAPVSGKVEVSVPRAGSAVLSAARQIPVGSVIDASQGAVELTAADISGNPAYCGQFSRGEFEVQQSVSGGGATQVVLEGACTKASTASTNATGRLTRADAVRRAAGADPVATAAHGKPRAGVTRYLQITADGKFVIVGANGTASEVGPAAWVVNDNCNGTTSVDDHSGSVNQASTAGHVTQLGPGESGELYCQPRKGALKYCEAVVSGPDVNFGHFELDLYHRRAEKFEVCLVRGGRTNHCLAGTFKHSSSGTEGTVLECYLNTVPKGAYETRFLVGGRQIGIELPWRTDHTAPLVGPHGSSCATYRY